ncbi:MAG: hypothetical protein WC254_04580 [Candidatus Woesearchaeota archaeon]|jgi:LEA14-like dessication related protein
MKYVYIIIGVIILLALFPVYQLYALHAIEMQSFTITDISLSNNLQFIVNGSSELYNPSLIPVTIKEIRYEAYIGDEQILNGTVTGKKIPARSGESFTFNQQIEWIPDIETALDITAGKNVTMIIKGETDVSYLSIFTITGNQEKVIDISKIIKPVLNNQIVAISNAVGFFLN